MRRPITREDAARTTSQPVGARGDRCPFRHEEKATVRAVTPAEGTPLTGPLTGAAGAVTINT